MKRLLLWWQRRRVTFNPSMQGYPPGLVPQGQAVKASKTPRDLVGREFTLWQYRYRIVGWTPAAEPSVVYEGTYEAVRIGKQ